MANNKERTEDVLKGAGRLGAKAEPGEDPRTAIQRARGLLSKADKPLGLAEQLAEKGINEAGQVAAKATKEGVGKLKQVTKSMGHVALGLEITLMVLNIFDYILSVHQRSEENAFAEGYASAVTWYSFHHGEQPNLDGRTSKLQKGDADAYRKGFAQGWGRMTALATSKKGQDYYETRMFHDIYTKLTDSPAEKASPNLVYQRWLSARTLLSKKA